MTAILGQRCACVLYLALVCVVASPAQSQQSVEFSYTYDATGQLVRVIDSLGSVVTYNYDLAGNLISVTTKTTADLGPPVLNSVTPTVVNHGETVQLILLGSNLLLGSLTLTDLGLEVLAAAFTDEDGLVLLEVPLTAGLGTAILTVTTSLGSDSIPFEVRGPLPKVFAVAPGSGTSLGGTSVTLTGQNLTASTTVSFGGVPAASQSFVDSTRIDAVTPAGAAGAVVAVGVTNSNGSTALPAAFSYRFPFGLPGAIAVVTGGAGTVGLTFQPPPAGDVTLTLSSSDPAVVSVPPSVFVAAGTVTVSVPITAGGVGNATITVSLGSDSLQVGVQVSPAVSGIFELTAPVVGVLNATLSRPVLAPIVSVLDATVSDPVLAKLVGATVSPQVIPAVALSGTETKTVDFVLAGPAPAGGLCADVTVFNPSVASAPLQVCIAAGVSVISVPITAGATGETLLSVVAGAESFELRVRVNLGPAILGAVLAPIVGVLNATLSRPVLAPVVGVLDTTVSDPVLAKVVGATVSPQVIPAVALSGAETKTVDFVLVSPAPAGGLCADVTVFTQSIATAPAQVCIAAGVSIISVPITAGASGETLLSVVAGVETFELRVRVNLGAENLGAGIAPVVGVLNATSSNPVLAPVVGVLNATTSDPVLAPIVGAEIQ